jgi:hypothetical protein
MGDADRQRPTPSSDLAPHRLGDFQFCPCAIDRMMRLEAVQRTAEWRTDVRAALLVRVDALNAGLNAELKRKRRRDDEHYD